CLLPLAWAPAASEARASVTAMQMLKVRVMMIHSPLASSVKRGEIKVRLKDCSAAADRRAHPHDAEPIEFSSRAARPARRERDTHGAVPRRQVFAIQLLADFRPAIHVRTPG